ncbi:hypothetical protein [Rhizobium anhuiense]
MARIGATAHQNTAFLTGAPSAIGTATASALVETGCRVIGASRNANPDEVCDGNGVNDDQFC